MYNSSIDYPSITNVTTDHNTPLYTQNKLDIPFDKVEINKLGSMNNNLNIERSTALSLAPDISDMNFGNISNIYKNNTKNNKQNLVRFIDIRINDYNLNDIRLRKSLFKRSKIGHGISYSNTPLIDNSTYDISQRPLLDIHKKLSKHFTKSWNLPGGTDVVANLLSQLYNDEYMHRSLSRIIIDESGSSRQVIDKIIPDFPEYNPIIIDNDIPIQDRNTR